MQVIVNGRRAVLKAGSSFDYVAENRLFSGSDAFTLSITFPMRDCPENVAIFGRINRQESDPTDIAMDCELRERRFSRYGVLTVVAVSESEIKGQFLEGKSAQNFDKTFGEIYINDLTLGTHTADTSVTTPERAWAPGAWDWQAVALPWWSVDTGMEHNFARWNAATGKYEWTGDITQLTFMPYLLWLTRRICEEIGYRYDFSQWEADRTFSRLVVCNVLPPAWNLPDYGRTLPRWTVDEYFEKLGLFMKGEFTIDHKEKSIDFAFSRRVLESLPEVMIREVVSEFSVDIKEEGTDCDYLETKPLAYKTMSHQMQKYYDCGWFLDAMPPRNYATMSALFADVGKFVPLWNGDYRREDPTYYRLHADDIDRDFIIRSVSRRVMRWDKDLKCYVYQYHCILQSLDEFGRRESSLKDEDAEEIEFVPACIDITDMEYGPALFVSCGSYSEDGATVADAGLTAEPDFPTWEETADEFCKGSAQRLLEAGESEGKHEYFSEISVGYYDGTIDAGGMACPHVSSLGIDYKKREAFQRVFDLSLRGAHYAAFHNIERRRRYTFKFLADDIPNPRALFHIKGQRYVCEKITATFTEDGMSQLLKGEFFRVAEE